MLTKNLQDMAMTFKEYLNPRYLYVTIKITKSLQRFLIAKYLVKVLFLLINDQSA
jgi:hypothetical protein